MIACGLYYMAEFVEEYTVLSKKIIQRSIWVCPIRFILEKWNWKLEIHMKKMCMKKKQALAAVHVLPVQPRPLVLQHR